MKLGSLFDGIGGFPLAAERNGIHAAWASETERFPMEVTKRRFSQMRHMGDITKIHGSNLPIVDVITGGSPCQDLSVAGCRRGLEGSRSGLFMEQVRLVEGNAQAGRKEGKKQWKKGRSACTTSVYGLGKCARSLLKWRTKRGRFPYRP